MIKEKKVVRTDRINTLIFEIARQSGSLAQKKTGKTEFEIDFSRLVELRGAKPPNLVLCAILPKRLFFGFFQ